MTDAIVTVAHVRAAGLCMRGARAWAARHGIEWSRFLREGVPASALAGCADPLLARVLEEARRG